MPRHALQLGIRYFVIGTLMSGSVVSTTLMAQRVYPVAQAAGGASEAFSNAAERWGLFAAMTLSLVAFSVWSLYKQNLFVQNRLVDLVAANQRCIDRVSETIKDSPCGKNWDSDRVKPG